MLASEWVDLHSASSVAIVMDMHGQHTTVYRYFLQLHKNTQCNRQHLYLSHAHDN